MEKQLQNRNSKLVWIHAASVGEYEQGLPVIRGFKEAHQDISVLLTFFSPSGFKAYSSVGPADVVTYLPLDYPQNVRDFIELVKPDLAVFIKYEFWYNYMNELHLRKIPLVLVSAVFRPDQMFFHFLGKFYLEALKHTSHFFLQDEDSAELLASHGMDQYTVAGDTRMDQMLSIKSTEWRSETVEAFVGESLVVICGSVWPSDWQYLNWLIAKYPDVKFLVAPHEVSDKSLAIYDGDKTVRMSDFSRPGDQVMVVDSVGSLKYMYRYADVAYVGGAFRGAVHNTVEPAVYSLPIVIGGHPNNNKFNEVKALLELGGLQHYVNKKELFDIFEALIRDSKKREEMGKKNLEYVNSLSGATARIMAKLDQYL